MAAITKSSSYLFFNPKLILKVLKLIIKIELQVECIFFHSQNFRFLGTLPVYMQAVSSTLWARSAAL